MSNKLSRERKVFIGILGVALIGLGADRVFFSSSLTGPAEASAAMNAVAADTSLDLSPVQVDAEPAIDTEDPEIVTARLAGRFEAYARQGGAGATRVANVFEPSDSWPGAPDPSGGVVQAVTAADEFAASHRLNAVMMSRSNPGAVVNKRLLTVGQEINGFILIEVNERAVIFEGDGGRVVLELDPPADLS